MKAANRLARALPALPLCGLWLAACYQPKPLDARSLMNEVAAEPRPAGAGAPTTRAPAVAGTLTEDEAVAFALRQNPDLRAVRDERGIAEGQIVAAGALANPTVDFDAIHLEDWASRRGWALGIGWAPPQPGAYSAKRAAAREGAAAVVADIAEAEWQLTIDVRAAHATLLALTEQRELVEKALEGRRQIVAMVTKRVNGGASTRLDLGLAELAVTQVERDRDGLAVETVAAATALGNLLGTGPVAGAAGALPDSSTVPAGIGPLVDEALASRPALVAAERRFAQREQTLRMEHARSWPWFRITAIPRYRADASDVHPNDFALGLQLTLPILDQNAGPIQVAEATRDQERDLFRRQVIGLRRDLESARDVVALRVETLKRYETQVLPSLDTQEKLMATAAAGGQMDVVAVLQSADLILRSRREYVDIRLSCYRARLELERAVGRRAAGK